MATTITEAGDVRIRGIFKAYPAPVGRVFNDFSLELRRGEIVAVLGPSGCGKSTLLNLISGVDSLASPTVIRGGGVARLGYVFQTPKLIEWRSVLGNAFFEADARGVSRDALAARLEKLLRIVRLDRYVRMAPNDLSAGMRQRLQVIRAILWKPQILLLDEPLGAVDQPLRLKIASSLRLMLKSDGAAAIWVTHDSLESVTVADRVIVIGRRPARIIEEHTVIRGNAEEVPAIPHDVDTIEAQARKLRNAIGDDEQTSEVDSESRRPHSLHSIAWRSALRGLRPLIPILTGLACWEVAVRIHPQWRFYVSMPSAWLRLGCQELVAGSLASDVYATAARATLGFLFGIVMGSISGFCISLSDYAREAIRPILVGLTAIPLFVLAPALILWFGVGPQMKVAVAALSCFPFVAYLVLDSAVAARDGFYRYLRFSGVSTWSLAKHLLFPATLAGIVYAIRPAAVVAIIGAFLGEFIASENGLGHYILLNASRYSIDNVFVGVALLFVCAAAIDLLAAGIRRVFPGLTEMH